MRRMEGQPALVNKLADDLERVSYYGVGRPMDLIETDIPHLAVIARYLTPDPRGRLRVSIALAVRQAVLLLDPPTHSQAAATLLWLDLSRSDYDEDATRKRKTLKERYPEVAALLGKGLASYERRKQWRQLYERIASNLLLLRDRKEQPLGGANHAPDATATPLTEEEQGIAHLLLIAEAGADLHYAALTSLFVAHFHNECAITHLANPRLTDWDQASDLLFCAFCRLLGRYVDAFGGHRSPDPLNAILKVAARYAMYNLDQLIRLVELCGPYANPDMLAIARSYGLQLDTGRTERRNSAVSSQELDVQDISEGAWMPWYHIQFLGDAEPWPPTVDRQLPYERLYPDSICLLVALGERVVSLIAGQVQLTKPVLTASRKRTRRIIATLYDIDEGEPMTDGISLRDRADRFLDEADYMLAPGAHPWYYKDSSIEELSERCKNAKRDWIADVKNRTRPDGNSVKT